MITELLETIKRGRTFQEQVTESSRRVLSTWSLVMPEFDPRGCGAVTDFREP